MTTSVVLGLPLARVQHTVSSDEDIMFGLSFMEEDFVTPLDLSGVDFSLTIGVGGSAVTLTTTPAQGMTVDAEKGALYGWLPIGDKRRQNLHAGAYALSLVASDGDFTRDVYTGSTLTVSYGQTTPMTLVRVASPFTNNVLVAIPFAEVGTATPTPTGAIPDDTITTDNTTISPATDSDQ